MGISNEDICVLEMRRSQLRIKRRSGFRKDSGRPVLWQMGGGRDSFRDCCQEMAMSPGRGQEERVSGWAVPWRSMKRVNITLGPLPPVISL